MKTAPILSNLKGKEMLLYLLPVNLKKDSKEESCKKKQKTTSCNLRADKQEHKVKGAEQQDETKRQRQEMKCRGVPLLQPAICLHKRMAFREELSIPYFLWFRDLSLMLSNKSKVIVFY